MVSTTVGTCIQRDSLVTCSANDNPARDDRTTTFNINAAVTKTFRRIGLARALSKLGYCSRSKAAELIRAGRVQLNDRIHRDPEAAVRLERDRIAVDGHAIEPQKHIYLKMNKPRRLVTTAADEKGRKTIYEVLQKQGEALPWVAPVGRLDGASEGLLLLTNDSEWGARISAPETHLEKTYHVQIGTVAGEKLMRAIETGVTSNGDRLRATQARLLRAGEKNCWLEITPDEGKNRQIRRIFEALDVDVLRLVRVAVGPLRLGKLPKGSYRPLTAQEKTALDVALGLGQSDASVPAGLGVPSRLT
jgi:23S rRNA pseudouridine2605 synthase